jgi:hypothetical protein
MSVEPREIVLLTRFRLTSVMRVVLKGRGRVQRIYYDPYGTWHGPVFRLLIALVGRPRFAAFIDGMSRLLRLPLRQVPHGQEVPNYESLEMAANIDATYFLSMISGAMRHSGLTTRPLQQCSIATNWYRCI